MIGHVNNVVADGQRRDCTIRALASLCNTDYHKVELILATAGKDDNRGFDLYSWLDANGGRVFGCQFTLVRRHQFVGRYLIGNYRHVQALIDGTIYDNIKRGISYRWCYKVELGYGSDKTTQKLDELASQGIRNLSEWKPTRQRIVDSM